MKDVIFRRTSTGCVIPTSHKLNPDGYFRKCIDGKLTMYHRYVWEVFHGPIPSGYEVDHICRNRACCNPNHLQLLDRTSHLVKTNKERYADRFQEAKTYWFEHKCTGTFLSKLFDVTTSCACRWIRGWKQEGVETIPKGSRADKPEAPSPL